MLSRLNKTYISKALAKKLEHITNSAVTTIVAPMGYGKTKAVEWWISQQSDNEKLLCLRQIITTDSLNDFWQGLCRNLRGDRKLYEEMTALGFPTELKAWELMLNIVAEALKRNGRQVFYILDDLHFISSPKIAEFIAFLGERMPEQLHLVLLSRNNIFTRQTDFKMGSRRYGLDIDDLRLTEQGLLTYAKRCGLKLTPEQATALIEQTEGWFAIIYLNLRSYLKEGHWLDSTESVYEVVDEVLFRSLPEQQAEFLVRMGLPEAFSLEEAEWLWPEGDAGQLLAGLTQQNAFITKSGGVYRYHNMLLDCAREKFSQQPLESQNSQLLRLRQWYAKTGNFYAAELCFERCGAWDELLAVLFADRGWSITGENCSKLFTWCQLCPENSLKANPKALLVLMRKLFSFGQIPEMLRLQKLLLAAMEEDQKLSLAEKDNYRGECQFVMSFTAYNDISAMSRYHREAYLLMNRSVVNIDPRGYWTFGAPSILMMFHRKVGAIEAENAAMRDCMPYYYQLTDYHGNGVERVMQAETDFLQGNFVDAELSCHFALTAARSKEQYSILAAAYFLQMQKQVFEGDLALALTQLAELRELLIQQRQYYLLYTWELMRAWLYALVGRPADKMPDWLANENQTSPLMRPAWPMQEIIRNQVFLAEGKWAAVAAREEPVALLCQGYNALLCSIWLEIQLASAYEQLGKSDLALEHLQAALEAALPDGLLLPMVFSCGYLSNSLPKLADKNCYQAEMEKIGVMAGQFKEAKARIWQEHWNPVPDYGLTEQELETARLAATALSLTEIAQKLLISEGTVKNRLTVIYDKLELTGRNKRLALAKQFETQLSKNEKS